MADNINNKKKVRDQDPLSWENMSEEIFSRVLEQDPGYFTPPKRKRRVAWIFLAGIAAAITITTIGVHLNSDSQNSAPPIEEPDIKKLSESIHQNKPGPIAAINNSPGPVDNNTLAGGDHTRHSDNSIQQRGDLGEQMDNVASPHDFMRNHPVAVPSDAPSLPLPHANSRNANAEPTTNGRSQIDIRSLESQVAFVKISNTLWKGLDTSRIKPDVREPKAEDDSKWQIHGSSGTLFSASQLSGNSAAVDFRNNNTSPLFGFSGNIGATYKIGRSSYLFFGASYEQAYQQIDIETEREVEITQTEVLLRVTRYIVGSRISETYGDTTVRAVERNRLVYTNTHRWLYFNFGAGKSFSNSNWQFRPAIGASFGRLWSEGYTVAADGQILKFDRSKPIHATSAIKMWASFAVSRRLTDRLSVNLGYRFDKQLNNASMEEEISFKPIYHHLDIGLAVRL